MISLAAGAPSPETFPIEELAEISARVIRDRGRFALQYGPTRGQSTLIAQLVEILRSRRIATADPDGVVMTTGSQQGLDLIARLLLDPGDVALVELPSYTGGIIALHNSRAKLVGVRQDGDGLDPDHLESTVQRARESGQRVKCLYTIPNFQNPSGVTLAPERRERIVEIAERYDFLIIEDDPYFDLHFEEATDRLPPLAALSPERTIYLSSFSKVLAPGLRCAWIFAPGEIAAKLDLLKEGADLSSSILDQAIVGESIRVGLIESRLPGIRAFYRSRCKAMLEALEEHAPVGARWTSPTGGFFILLELREETDMESLLPVAIKRGVAYVPGNAFFVNGAGANTARLAFSKEPPENIREGIRLLCETITSG